MVVNDNTNNSDDDEHTVDFIITITTANSYDVGKMSLKRVKK